MRVFLFLLLALTGLGFSQVPTVKTLPEQAGAGDISGGLSTIMDQDVGGSTTPVWSSSFPISHMFGAVSIFVSADTTLATSNAENSDSDSCLTLFYQIKDNVHGWTRYYTDTIGYTRIDSVARSIVNVGSAVPIRFNLANTTGWSPGDSCRIGVTLGTTDSLNILITYQGQ